jgi:hypothetical protein
MPISTRGRSRDTTRAVRVNPNLHYGFKTFDLATLPGISAADVLALGQKPLASGLGLVVFSPRAPKPARFSKRLFTGLQSSIAAFGDGSSVGAISTAQGSGWRLTKPVSKLRLSRTARTREAIIPATNTLYVAYRVPIPDYTPDNISLLGWIESNGVVTLNKTVRSPQGVKISLVTLGTKTLPCASAKVPQAQAAGWTLTQEAQGLAPLL